MDQPKNTLKDFSSVIILSVFAVLFVIGISFNNYVHNQETQKKQEETQGLLEKEEITSLKNQLQVTEVKLKELADRPPDIIYQTTTIESPKEITTSDIVKEWSPQVVFITCSWYYTDNITRYATGSGSGFLTLFSGGEIAIMTNRHVILFEDTYSPKFCTISFLNGEQYTSYWINKNFSYSTKYDKATIDLVGISNTTKELVKRTSGFWCTKEPDIGDKVVVMGYPVIGSSTGITVTEGIISGYENEYYVISAKLEHGNSGGIAVSVKDNCIIGIPSAAIGGSVESLGRILSSTAILEP
jgi:hypothetical protein